MPNNDENLREAYKLLQARSNKPFINELSHKIAEAVVKAKTTQALVESATVLTESEKNLLKQLVEKLIQRDLKFTYEIDPALFGGFKVTVGDWIIDATVAEKLNSLRQYLTNEK